MSLIRRTHREVLRDKAGVALSMPEVLASMGLKGVILSLSGAALVGLLGFWAVSAASADTSSGFQNANIAFEKAVRASDVVVGFEDDKVGLLKDLDENRCEVQAWQAGTREGKNTLRVDTVVLDELCTTTVSLPDPGSGDESREFLFDINAPAFSYANLGGRSITFDAEGTATLAAGSKPEGVKQGDWDDLRPYKVTLELETANADAAAATEKAVVTGYTNVVNVAAAKDSLRYVPVADDRPIPGPIKIVSVDRSTQVGTTYTGAREGIAVSFHGGVCTSGPTKVSVSFTQHAPSAAAPVSVVANPVLTGNETTVQLEGVRNGASGAVEVSANCVEEGVVVKDAVNFTQQVPAPNLTAKLNATAPHNHDLAWQKVSSLPTQFEITRKVGTAAWEPVVTTDKLSHQVRNEPGSNLGLTTKYEIKAIVGDVKSEPTSRDVTNAIATPSPAANVKPGDKTVSWNAASCPAYSHAEYSVRYYQQSGTSTAVNWSGWTAWSRDLRATISSLTPDLGRTVYEVRTRCVADQTGQASQPAVSGQVSFYAPERPTLSVTRSTVSGSMVGGVREGVRVIVGGSRCYGGTQTKISVTWTPQGVSAPPTVTQQAQFNNGSVSIDFPNAPNGVWGQAAVTLQCVGVTSGSDGTSVGYVQPLPKPTLTVTQHSSNANAHVLSWSKVSSLPTTFQTTKSASYGTQHNGALTWSGLSATYSYNAGTTYGNRTNYAVTATVSSNGSRSATSDTKSITTAWPAPPSATNIGYRHTGSSAADPRGTVSWGYSGSCPAGTTQQTQRVENRTGQSNGTISTATRWSSGWGARMTSYSWAPSYALQGYAYGLAVQDRCVSNVTGLTSSTSTVQSGNWVTPMAKPAKPVWDAYNFRDRVRGTSWTYSTCFAGGCPSMVVDYKTYCPSGAHVNWSNFTSTDWNPFSYNHGFGWQDNWYNPYSYSRYVTYHNAKYSCGTPWAGSPQSDPAPNKQVEVLAHGR